VRRACSTAGLVPYDDPHNADPSFTRSRVRAEVLPALERELGPGVAAALARTADQLRADADALEELARAAAEGITGPDGTLDCRALAAAPRALRTRVLLTAAAGAGCPRGRVGAAHVDALDALVTAWRGQGPVALPGGVVGMRRCGRLLLVPGAVGSPAGHGT
jgi:tRNA(Ile)-lysidine synthase